MEPRRDDGDDSPGYLTNIEKGRPQWSPVVTTGTTPDGSRVLLAHSCEPQWSPVVTTGTTFSSWAAACDYEKGRNGAPS